MFTFPINHFKKKTSIVVNSLIQIYKGTLVFAKLVYGKLNFTKQKSVNPSFSKTKRDEVHF